MTRFRQAGTFAVHPARRAERHLTERFRSALAISHRGAHDVFPENTLPAFRRAIELGADAIELDVHATSDGVVVVHHDSVLNAGDMPRNPTPISTSSRQQLRDHPLARGVAIPSLDEALEEIGTRAKVFIEIKARDIEPLVVRCIRNSAAECSVHSFDHRIVRSVKQLFPAIRCGVLQVARPLDPVAALRAVGAEDLWQHVDYVDPELVRDAHGVGVRVIAWTANDESYWPVLRRMGVDGICTDRIGELAAVSR